MLDMRYTMGALIPIIIRVPRANFSPKDIRTLGGPETTFPPEIFLAEIAVLCQATLLKPLLRDAIIFRILPKSNSQLLEKTGRKVTEKLSFC